MTGVSVPRAGGTLPLHGLRPAHRSGRECPIATQNGPVPLPRDALEPSLRAGSAALPAEGGLESTSPHEPGTRSGALDGLRALAALAVVVTHVGFESGRFQSGAIGAVVGRMDVGVAVFFVLSGFLLGRPFALWALGQAARPDLRRYAARRAVRVLPAYWLMLTVTLLVLQPREIRGPGDLAWQYALLQPYDDYRVINGLSHVWSLSTELAFYIALPLVGWALLAVARRSVRPVARALALLGGAAVAGLVFHGLVQAGVVLGPSLAPQWLPARFDWFALGLGLAVLTTPRGARSRPGRLLSEVARSPGLCWAGAGALLWIACTPVAGARGFATLTAHESLSRELLYGCIALLLVIPVAAGPTDGGRLRAGLQSRVAVALGRISYGIFLWHLLVLEVVTRTLDLELFAFPFWSVLLLVVAITAGVAWASWQLVERPLLELVDRRLARRARAEQRGGGRPEREEHEQLRDSGVRTG